VRWLGCGADGWEPIVRSAMLGLDVAPVVSAIDWP
jgi:hypothetical protein